jgi:UDP-N-acetyl-2-amino-2-deoxyglucuronate dehydrogenase
LSILGSEGTVVIGGFAVNKMLTWRFTHEEEGDAEVLERYSVNPPSVYGFGHQAYYQHVVDCLDRSVPHLVDGTQGRRSLQLIHAIYKSIETGQRIDLKSAPVFPLLGRRDG